MKLCGVRERFVREEGGFTLPEMLVTIMIMITVLFALYSIFDMSLRVFSFGNDKVEAVENARLGLERMEREIRAAYPYDKTDNSTTNDYLLPPGSFTSDSIAFGNDTDPSPNGDRKITPASEQITYSVSSTANPATACANDAANPCTLRRSVGTGAPQQVVEYLYYDDNGTPANTSDDIPPLQLQYLKSDGITATTSEPEVDIVRIELRIRVEGGQQDGTQTLTTDVALRNRES